MPCWILVIQLAWLIALVIMFFVWIRSPHFRSYFPHFYGHDPGIPVEAPWFGAMGGCIASLGGIFAYNRRWKRSYDYWHALKAPIGAITGTVSCLLLVVILRSATANNAIKTDPMTFDAVAFLFGYAESAFRELVRKATDVLIKPGNQAPGGANAGRATPTRRRRGSQDAKANDPPDDAAAS